MKVQASSARRKIFAGIFNYQIPRLQNYAIFLELDLRGLAVGLRGLKELARRETEHPGQNVRGERLNLRVQVAHHCVVITPRILNRVFCLAQRSLQLSEFLRSLELRIILRDRE